MFMARRSIYNYLKSYKTWNVRFSTKAKPEIENSLKKLNNLLEKYENSLVYSCFLERHKIKLGYRRNLAAADKLKKMEQKRYMKNLNVQPLPLGLKYCADSLGLSNEETVKVKVKKQVDKVEENPVLQFPYETDTKIELKDSRFINKEIINDPAVIAQKEIESRLHYNWMADYETYEKDDIATSNVDYGTPDPKSKISNVPCGGCGALLHCKDTSIPGYIPSEIYKNTKRFDGVSLKSIICQRCYFLRNYKFALQVRVSPDDYPKILRTIQSHNKALVILIVDLLDFPCSIWPGAADLLGYGRPIFVVGNKIDLLPQDGKNFLKRIEDNLRTNLKLNGFASTDIKHVSLISATTGFGIEDMITKLQSFWGYNGDVFLVGCTNVGKSSLFNALLQSDYCKTHAVDLIQRATISQWPGTTLNLLKFPINRPSGYKLYMRCQRLKKENKIWADEKQLRLAQLKKTKKPTYATLIGHIGQTFVMKDEAEGQDMFSINPRTGGSTETIGIDEEDEIYAASKWCYDTPGVIQSEQVLHLLTAEELMLTLPKGLIRPRTFTIKPGTSIFIGGLSRLDFIEGVESTKFTVFCSSHLPITVCQLKDADDIYNDFLPTEFFSVPDNSSERLQRWPGLTKSKEFTVKGVDREISCADIVLSSSGWISITPRMGKEVRVKGWVPMDCGIHLRDPLLPNAVQLRGKRIRYSPSYQNNRYYISK